MVLINVIGAGGYRICANFIRVSPKCDYIFQRCGVGLGFGSSPRWIQQNDQNCSSNWLLFCFLSGTFHSLRAIYEMVYRWMILSRFQNFVSNMTGDRQDSRYNLWPRIYFVIFSSMIRKLTCERRTGIFHPCMKTAKLTDTFDCWYSISTPTI